MTSPHLVGSGQTVEAVHIPLTHVLGGFELRRALPMKERQMVSPFLFCDHMRIGEFLTCKGLDVRPHPDIEVATVTYFCDDSIVRLDSLRSEQIIVRGNVNWKTAGRKIAHLERADPPLHAHSKRPYGIQFWVAMLHNAEEAAAAFVHYPVIDQPNLEDRGGHLRLIVCEGLGLKAFVMTHLRRYTPMSGSRSASRLPDGARANHDRY